MTAQRDRALRLVLGVVILVVAVAGAALWGTRADSAVRDVQVEGSETRHDRPAPGLLARIRALEPVLSAQRTTTAGPYRGFRVRVAVPVDHADPDGPTFPLRLTLLHRDARAPMVLHTSG